MKDYYIQAKGQPAKHLFNDFGIYVKSVVGLDEVPPIKKVFKRDWKDEQGNDVYIPDDLRFKSKTVKITFLRYIDDNTDVKAQIKEFLNYIYQSNYISYYDTYRNNGFYGYYSKEKVSTDRYRNNSSFIEFDMTFEVPNGICFGVETTNALISVNKGNATVHKSDGTGDVVITESDGDVLINSSGKYLIICPSIWNNNDILIREFKVLGINNKVLGINNKVLGI